MPEKNTPYVVPVGIDYTPVSTLALATAHELASFVPNGELRVVHLVSHRATDGQREGSVANHAEPSMTVVL